MSWYDTKQSNGEAPVMLELWGIRSTSSLPSLPGPLWPGVAAPDWVLSMGQIELNSVLMLEIELFWNLNYVLMLNWIVWNETVFDIETILTLNRMVWNKTVLKKTMLMLN